MHKLGIKSTFISSKACSFICENFVFHPAFNAGQVGCLTDSCDQYFFKQAEMR